MSTPSAAAERLAAQWVADALAADEGINFSVIKALVGVSSEYLVGAPDAARERVALRCLQELAAFAVVDEGGAAAAAAAAPSGMLRVDASRSCEDLLVELTGQVGSSKSFDKDKILPFRQDIQNFISIKKPALPEFSLELLREVDPEIQSVGASSPGDQSGIKKHDNDQSLCSVNHPHSNVEKPRLPKVSPELQPENSTNVVNETEKGNFQQCPIEPTVDLDQPCASESRFYDQQQEDAINAASVGARSPEKNLSNVDSDMPVAAVPASVSCNVTLQGNIVEPLSKKDKADKTTMDQSTGKSSNPNDDGISDQSLKDRSHESQTVQATPAPPFDRSNDVLPTNTTEASHLPEVITTEDTTMVHQPNSFKTHLSHLQHDTGQKVSQDLDGSAGIPRVEKDPIHAVRAPSAIPSVTCNGAMQEDKSGTNHPSGSTTEHTATLEEQNGDKSQLEVSCADKNNHILCDDGTMLERNKVCGGLNVHTAPESSSCNVTLHDKISESNSLSEQNIGKNTTAIPKRSCSISVPNSSQDGDRKRAKQDSNKQSGGETLAETSHVQTAAHLLSMTGKMPFCSQDQEANDSLGVSQEQDLCIKCGKDGQLLQCSSCLLSAHDSCFGSSVTIEDSEQFYCPVCICTKATEAYQKAKKKYIEARKNLAAFLGTEQLLKQHDDQQQTGVLPRSANSEAQLNGQNLSNRQDNSNQTNTDDLAHQGEESDRQKKKQKINVTSDACKEAVIEKAFSVRNSDMAAMNKHSVLQNDSNQPHDAEKDHHVENTEAREDADNCYSPHGRRDSCQNRCSPANPEAEADKVGGPSNSRESEDSDEIEATSSNNSGKRTSPPWRHIKHHKARPQEREATLSSNSRKAFGQQDQHMPSPSRKRNYAYPPKRYSNPVVPTGRRSKLCWTEEEEAALREAMEKFTPRDDGPIPWIQILEHGRNVFHRTRLPCDLRVKWRNMKKKAGS